VLQPFFDLFRVDFLYMDQYPMTYIISNAELRAKYDLSRLKGWMFSGAGTSVAFKASSMKIFPTSVVSNEEEVFTRAPAYSV